jgi:subtilisin family serine protease
MLLALLAAPPYLAGTAEKAEVVERFAGPESGEEYVVLFAAEGGGKWIEAPDGRRFASVAAVHEAELRGVGEPLCRIDPELRPAVLDPVRHDEPVWVLLVLREQPLHDASEDLREGLERDIDDLMGPARAIPKELEPAEATEEQRRVVGDAIQATRARIRTFRSEVFDRAAPRCEALQASVLAGLGERATGSTVLVNAVWAEMAPADLPRLIEEHPEIWRVVPARASYALPDKSVGSVGASSFWTGGYTGSGAYVCVLDTGIDNQHPALKNGIAYEKVFLAYGKGYSAFNDDATSTDDLQGHGTHCAGIAGSRDTTYTGVAKGVNLVNGKWMFRMTGGYGVGFDPDLFDAVKWARDNSDVFSCSFGGSVSNNDGSSSIALLMDAVVHDLKIHSAVAAGNASQAGAGSVITPGDAFNVVTVGNYYDNGTTSPSDDSLTSSSCRGPTKDGRLKPEFSAPGTLIKAANARWEGDTNPDFVNKTGTSMAAPHVAGGMGLLVDYRSSYTPQALKALLVNTSRNTSPFPSTPDNNWGFGGMNLTAAYSARADVTEGTLTSTGAESLYYTRSSSLASGDRATLAWNRHVTYSSTDWPGTPPALLDLDLYLYNGSTGAEDAKSVSTVNSVEQVKATGTVAKPVIRIHRSGSFPSAFTTESWALAAPSGFATVAPPELGVTAAAPKSPVGPGEVFTLSVTVSNIGGLPAVAPEVTLDLPTGYSLDSGTNPATLGDVAAGGSGVVAFSVKASSTTELATIEASAESVSFGETVSGGPASRTQQVDATPPTGSVTIDGGDWYSGDEDVTLTLSATDALTEVSRMRFSNDAATWSDWEDYTTIRTWTLSGGEGTQTVYAQFEDGVGNVSSQVFDQIFVDTLPPTGSVALSGGTLFTSSSAVTLALTATDGGSGVADMRLRNAGEVSWGPWIVHSSEKTWTLPPGEGSRPVEAQYRDQAGNVSTTYTGGIVVDWTAPTGTMTIEGGDDYTSDNPVLLSFSASDNLTGVPEVRLSPDGTTWGDWKDASETVWFLLQSADGEKTVHAQFRDGAGNVSTAATDTIVLDRTAPTGTVAFGSPYTNRTDVTATLSATDNLSGVAEARFRNEGGNWSDWRPFAATTSWTLNTGEGTQTVEAQFRDGASNLSTVASAAIVLDQTLPTGSLAIEGNWPATNRIEVELTIGGHDALSEVEWMRFSPDGMTWDDAWEPFADKATFTLPEGEGEKSVFMELVDGAGNVSDVLVDEILLDQTPPAAAFAVNGGAAYVLRSEGLVFSFDDSSEEGGSGLRDFRVSFDGGTSWSEPRSLLAGLAVEVARPGSTGLLSAEVVTRDMAGSESPPVAAPVYLLEEDLPRLVSGAKFRGAIDVARDVDALAVDVVKGDLLTVKVRGRSAEKRKILDVDLDLVGPWSGRILQGRYPADARKPGFKRFEMTVTGRYLVVVRRGPASDASAGTYRLRVAVKQSRESRSARGETTDGRIVFDAVQGAVLKGRLTAEGLSEGSVTLVGPAGPVELSLRETASGVVIRPTVLTTGTGTYELLPDTFRAVAYRLRLRPPKRPRGTLEE